MSFSSSIPRDFAETTGKSGREDKRFDRSILRTRFVVLLVSPSSSPCVRVRACPFQPTTASNLELAIVDHVGDFFDNEPLQAKEPFDKRNQHGIVQVPYVHLHRRSHAHHGRFLPWPNSWGIRSHRGVIVALICRVVLYCPL